MIDFVKIFLITILLYLCAVRVGFILARESHRKFQATGKKLMVQVHHLYYISSTIFVLMMLMDVLTLESAFVMSVASGVGFTRGLKHYLKFSNLLLR